MWLYVWWKVTKVVPQLLNCAYKTKQITDDKKWMEGGTRKIERS